MMVSQRERGATTLPPTVLAVRHPRGIWGAHWGMGITFGLCGAVAVGWGYGAAPCWRFSAGYLAAWLAQTAFVAAMRRRCGPEASSLADWLTLGRASAGALLAGMVASGVGDRLGLGGWLTCGVLVGAASALDWLDGPLARRLGPTRLGAALDIEADSWLTLWAGAAAVAWGELPWVVMVAPLLHYLHPIRAWLAGRLPQGDGVAWARVPGAAQMLLFAAALVPVTGDERDMLLTWAAYPIAAAQSMTMLLMLRRR